MCRPGIDQTTRSPPRWNLLAPQLEQRLKLLANTRVRKRQGPMEFLQHGLSWTEFEKLARIPAAAGVRPPSLLPSLGRPFPTGSISTLELLPSEILLTIIEALAIPDRLALAPSQVLWRHVVGVLHWLENLPGPLVTLYPELEEKLAQYWNWATYTYADVNKIDVEKQYRSAFWAQIGASGIAEELYDKLGSTLQRYRLCYLDLTPALGAAQPQHSGGTAQTAERRRRKWKREAAVKGIPWLTTDYVLVLHISWIVDGLGAAGDLVLYAGMWAGHCFDHPGVDYRL
ncbi:hypothetical protein GQ53DRAFT_770114 [Thozetella sp. PMI_491]|nr:hypothetical protein GQ53DRAFT_770114 [Thozetella sp. PMI_491]